MKSQPERDESERRINVGQAPSQAHVALAGRTAESDEQGRLETEGLAEVPLDHDANSL